MKNDNDFWPEGYETFSGSDKPAPRQGKGYQWKENIEDWNWLDFFNYFEDKHRETIGNAHWYNFKQRNSRKKVIEQSFTFWGKEIFKSMIDWLFENYKDYPQWEDIHIGLVCGSHGWAKMIGENAIKQMEADKRWNS